MGHAKKCIQSTLLFLKSAFKLILLYLFTWLFLIIFLFIELHKHLNLCKWVGKTKVRWHEKFSNHCRFKLFFSLIFLKTLFTIEKVKTSVRFLNSFLTITYNFFFNHPYWSICSYVRLNGSAARGEWTGRLIFGFCKRFNLHRNGHVSMPRDVEYHTGKMWK